MSGRGFETSQALLDRAQAGIDADQTLRASFRVGFRRFTRAAQVVDESARHEAQNQPCQRALEARTDQAKQKTDAAKKPLHARFP